MKSQDHFIASPLPVGDRLFVSGLGAFNVSTFYCLATDPKAGQRVAWTKSTPYLKLPTVSSPAISDGKLIFGDGMHQTDGAILYCLSADGSLPLWQLQVPGKLVHLEGSPAVVGNPAYIGGRGPGVTCVEIDRVTLEGKELDLPTIRKILDAKWKELWAKYEIEKKKDPDFAVEPTPDQLPKPAPKVAWQQGQEKWHVDAPVTVAGDKLLVCSAFLDMEKVGDRAIHCLDTKTGSTRWRTGLKLNPWGGASVSGDIVVIGGGNIGYDTKALKGARGEITALNLSDGKERWRKEVK